MQDWLQRPENKGFPDFIQKTAKLFGMQNCVKDGSGNPFMQRSEIKDCNVQPDPAATFVQAGTRPDDFRL